MMRKLLAVTTLMALGLVSGVASAQHGHDDHGRGYREQHGADGRRYNDGRGHDYRRDFRRGDRLPSEYRSRQYVVEDWRRHRLPPPPRGHRWVQVGAQYALVAIPTGVIVNLVIMP
jgi:Ni/Co efflux regulator RcnB